MKKGRKLNVNFEHKRKVKSHWTRWLLSFRKEKIKKKSGWIVDGVYFLLHGDFMECVIGFKGHSHLMESERSANNRKTPLNFNVRQFTLSSRTPKYAMVAFSQSKHSNSKPQYNDSLNFINKELNYNKHRMNNETCGWKIQRKTKLKLNVIHSINFIFIPSSIASETSGVNCVCQVRIGLRLLMAYFLCRFASNFEERRDESDQLNTHILCPLTCHWIKTDVIQILEHSLETLNSDQRFTYDPMTTLDHVWMNSLLNFSCRFICYRNLRNARSINNK